MERESQGVTLGEWSVSCPTIELLQLTHRSVSDPDPFAANPSPHSILLPPTRSTSVSLSTRTPRTGIAGGGSTPPVLKKNRTSLLVTASDTIFAFGTRRRASSVLRKPSSKSNPPDDSEPPILDIRSNPAEPEDEAEEREVLRNAAARAIGLDVEPRTEDPPSFREEDEDDMQTVEDGLSPSIRSLGQPRIKPFPFDSVSLSHSLARNMPTPASSAASLGGDTTQQHPPNPSRFPTLPQFPCSISSLTAFSQTSSTLLKHYPGGSFFLGRSRQWKNRHLVLTSLKPPPSPDRSDDPDTQAHLHLFRSSSGDERELERMKINEDSMVFVTDEGSEVVGKKFVLKVGGLNAGGTANKDRAPRTPPSTSKEEDFKIMWLLQCSDSATVQRWIGFVKTAILVQRFALSYCCTTSSNLFPNQS